MLTDADIKDEPFENYVSVFQNISNENLVSRVSEFIPVLEEIKIGKVSLTLIM